MQSRLNLTLGNHSWPLDMRPITIGRLPECDVVLDQAQVSRSHAYLIPTPEGPLLVDRSRAGTTVNGEVRHGPSLLAEGDELCIGDAVLQIRRDDERRSRDSLSTAPLTLRRRVRSWLRRYGPSEIVGTLAAVGVAGMIKQATGSTIAAAYLGALAENVAFYGIIFLRESIREAHQAGLHGRKYGLTDTMAVFRNLGLEFGVAEALDSGVVRPLGIGIGIQLIGGSLGALVGKLAADIVFYGPVLTTYEWRLAHNQAARREDHRRRTTGAALEVPPDS